MYLYHFLLNNKFVIISKIICDNYILYYYFFHHIKVSIKLNETAPINNPHVL